MTNDIESIALNQKLMAMSGAEKFQSPRVFTPTRSLQVKATGKWCLMITYKKDRYLMPLSAQSLLAP